MLNYNKKTVNILALLISILIFSILHFTIVQYKKAQDYVQSVNNQFILKTSEKKLFQPYLSDKKIPIKLSEIKRKLEPEKWSIYIEKINLEAPILETTSLEVMKKAVGHFEGTSIWNGNVCLAAHNRGYLYNYFARIKELEIGDQIFYETKEGKREYKVKEKKLIKETDLTPLEASKENQITLITCVENKPEYRVCIKAVQMKGEI